ncbi:hypothetical protein GCM10022291_26390 [Postechiella marina]|uniref:Uncharacterized protein n=1 Tax=Postechiella marina TaxID=943941 RepID=A0ABP8CDI3_9FLAO
MFKNKTINQPLNRDNHYSLLNTHGLNTNVFTQHELPQEHAATKFGEKPNEWLVLLNIKSIDEFNFWDAGTLTYCIHKKDLEIKEFLKIYTSIESS